MGWFRGLGVAGSALLAAALACAAAPEGAGRDPLRYRLERSGTHWATAGEDRVLEDLRPRYPEFFALVLDPSRSEEPNLLELRDDLEREPASRRNYDALNALAIAYFEINYRAQAMRGEMGFISGGFRAAQLAAVPWRAYGELRDGSLRDAILDFYADAATGEKLGTAATRGRLVGIVESLAAKETDARRRARIEAIAGRLRKDPEVR